MALCGRIPPSAGAQACESQAKLVGLGLAPGVLYDFGGYPAAMFKADARTRVIGEVYALNRTPSGCLPSSTTMKAYRGSPTIRFTGSS